MAYVYKAPTLTVDAVIFELIDNQLNVLLIQRNNEPLKGKWALPGGYIAASTTTMQALENRVLKPKVGIDPKQLPFIEQLYVFDEVDRDPRGPSVSITYLALGHDLKLDDSGQAQTPTFFPVHSLPGLAFDHEAIVRYAHERLQSRIIATSAIYALLPRDFTLTQLQQAYEAVLGHPIDKRNFRKKFLSFGLIESSDKYFQDGAHRPALLYHFKRRVTQPLERRLE